MWYFLWYRRPGKVALGRFDLRRRSLHRPSLGTTAPPLDRRIGTSNWTRFEVCSRPDLLALPPASAIASTLTCPPPLTLRVLSTVTATSNLTVVRPVSG